jgi:hypothetical protein
LPISMLSTGEGHLHIYVYIPSLKISPPTPPILVYLIAL